MKAFETPHISNMEVYIISKIVIWKNSPIKYLESKSLIFSSAFLNFDSWSSFIKIKVVFSNSLLSLRRKKLAKITEKSPIVKLLRAPANPFKNSGIVLSPILENRLFDIVCLFKLVLFQPIKSVICELKKINLLSRSSTFNSDKLSPCFSNNGMNN